MSAPSNLLEPGDLSAREVADDEDQSHRLRLRLALRTGDCHSRVARAALTASWAREAPGCCPSARAAKTVAGLWAGARIHRGRSLHARAEGPKRARGRRPRGGHAPGTDRGGGRRTVAVDAPQRA